MPFHKYHLWLCKIVMQVDVFVQTRYEARYRPEHTVIMKMTSYNPLDNPQG